MTNYANSLPEESALIQVPNSFVPPTYNFEPQPLFSHPNDSSQDFTQTLSPPSQHFKYCQAFMQQEAPSVLAGTRKSPRKQKTKLDHGDQGSSHTQMSPSTTVLPVLETRRSPRKHKKSTLDHEDNCKLMESSELLLNRGK
ncbi:uncharacterized protein LOC111117903 isoform X2 [Crassostrea virginica]